MKLKPVAQSIESICVGSRGLTIDLIEPCKAFTLSNKDEIGSFIVCLQDALRHILKTEQRERESHENQDYR